MSLCKKILTAKQSKLVDYADTEIKRLNLGSGDEYSALIADGVKDLISVLATQRHSGMSVGIALATFSRLAQFKPLTALTGEDDEWFVPTMGMTQNKRAFSVFKHEDGLCFDSNKTDDTPITFPYLPE